MCLGGLLPDPNDLAAVSQDDNWRVIWLCPAIIGSIQILLVLTVFNLEPPLYLVMEGREKEAIRNLSRIYTKKEHLVKHWENWVGEGE